MAEILAALLYCNLNTNAEGKYSLSLSGGRITAAIARLIVITTFGYLYNKGK